MLKRATLSLIIGLTLVSVAHASCSDESIKTTWQQLYDLYMRQPGCDDGAIAENNDESVKGILLNSSDFLRLEKLAEKTPKFGDFVILHTKNNVFTDKQETQRIAANIKANCPPQKMPICERLETAIQ